MPLDGRHWTSFRHLGLARDIFTTIKLQDVVELVHEIFGPNTFIHHSRERRIKLQTSSTKIIGFRPTNYKIHV